MRVLINGFLFCVIARVLGTADLDLTTWQYWVILILTGIIYIKAKLEEND